MFEENNLTDNSGKKLFTEEFFNKWYNHYSQLEALNKQGVITLHELEEELAKWVAIQQRIRHMLPKELRVKLDLLNFDLEEKGSTWEPMYRQLAEFATTEGHTYLPDDKKYEVLKDWLLRQILNKKFLSDSQYQRLNDLGVDWNITVSRDHQWEQMFSRLKNFYDAFGHCRVPQRWVNDKQLSNWVAVQRRSHSHNKLREDRFRRLDELGFVWHIQTQFNSQWEDYYHQLLTFHQEHGHCRVPSKQEKLVSWMERQRISRKKGLLQDDRQKRLDEIGFIWSSDKIKQSQWENRYQQLREFKKKHGHSFVPVNYKENKSLGIWVASQRLLESKGKLPAAKRQKLDKLGFVWSKNTYSQLKSIHDNQWNANFEKLKAYKQAHNTCQVSLKIDPALQRWTRWQRILFYQGRLSSDRISKLNELRFPWSVQEGYWMKMYDALLEFKKKFGHTDVPSQWAENPQLAAWVYRVKRDKEKLSSQKVDLLNKIGFKWTLLQKNVVPWNVMYSRLVEFKEKYGHTRVPVQWRENPKLGKWVSRMRAEKEKIAPERRKLLEAIQFDWGMRIKTRKTVDSMQTQLFNRA